MNTEKTIIEAQVQTQLNLNSQKDRELRTIQLLEEAVHLLDNIARNLTPAHSRAVTIELSAKPIPGQKKE